MVKWYIVNPWYSQIDFIPRAALDFLSFIPVGFYIPIICSNQNINCFKLFIRSYFGTSNKTFIFFLFSNIITLITITIFLPVSQNYFRKNTITVTMELQVSTVLLILHNVIFCLNCQYYSVISFPIFTRFLSTTIFSLA